MLSGIKEMAEAYDTVQLRWIRSHTNGSSLAELGNSRADNLAKVKMIMMIVIMIMMTMTIRKTRTTNNNDNDDDDGDGDLYHTDHLHIY